MSDLQISGFDVPPGAIAVTGMAGRFAGARDVDELWSLLARRAEGIRDLTPEELRAAGVTDRVLRQPDFVRRSGDLADVELFDAARFGIPASEAPLIDPQIRLLLELAWEALEAGTHVRPELRAACGVYVGVGYNTYLARNLLSHPDLLRDVGWFGLRHLGNDKDFAATTVAYRLDLRGPALSVQTACSTSLTALHLAVQALLGHECDVALAGAATVEVPAGAGYRYVPGEVLSPDGVCRPFDAQAGGTVLTSGAGVLSLRRLEDALTDGDPVLAVVRGTALNNDGNRKVSYYAPSIEGQLDVVREAVAVSGVDPRSISVVETHGTGTALGDPIEFAALAEALAPSPDSPVVLGSIKANIGHTDTAAGAAGLMKLVESMRRRTITPQANFQEPNPLIPLAGSGFRIATELEPWDAPAPRRAGLTSLGVGGTNAHVVVEEFLEPRAVDRDGEAPQVLLVSAPSDGELRRLAGSIADMLGVATPDVPTPAQAAATLALGRTAHSWRGVAVGRRTPELQAGLAGIEPVAALTTPRVVFLYPGAGPQRSGMIAPLLLDGDPRWSALRAAADEACDVVRAELGVDLHDLLRRGRDEAVDAQLRDPCIGLPALFVAEHALTRQLAAWGVVPHGALGHSMGEHAAAVTVGAATLRDAVVGIGARADAIATAAAAGTAMTAVLAGEDEVAELVGPDLDLAVVNAPDELVYSGAADAVAAFEARLRSAGVEHRRVNLAAAAHFRGLDDLLPAFRERMATTTQGRATGAFYSTLTGGRHDGPLDAEYWVQEVRRPVRFADALAAVAADGPFVAVEVAPGRVLSTAVRSLVPTTPAVAVLGGAATGGDPDVASALLEGAGRLWAVGVPIDPASLVDAAVPRVRLPVARLDGKRAWIDARPAVDAGLPEAEPDDPARLTVSRPVWRTLETGAATGSTTGTWLVDVDPNDAAATAVAAALGARGAETSTDAADGQPVAGALVGPRLDLAPADAAEDLVWRATQAANRVFDGGAPSGRVAVVTSGAWTGTPWQAASIGVPAVVAAELPGVTGVAIDLDGVATAADAALAAAVVLDRAASGVVRVTRGAAEARRWEPQPGAETVPGSDSAAPPFAGRTALVLGGLGHVGAAHARWLVDQGCARIVVTSRTPVDPPSTDRAPGAPAAQRAARLAALREAAAAAGATVEVAVFDADAPTALDDLHRLLRNVEPTVVVQAIGTLRDRLLAQSTAADVAAVLRSKVWITEALRAHAAAGPQRLVLLVGSASTVLGLPGQAAYIAANAVVDAAAGPTGPDGSSRVATVAWGRFADGGMATALDDPSATSSDAAVHPFFHRCTRRADGSVRLHAATSDRGSWVLDEHRVDGGAVLPATAHVALMLAACRAAASTDDASALPTLRDVTIIEPVIVEPGTVLELRAELDPPDRAIRTVRIEARGAGTASWTLHSQAVVTAAAGVPAHQEPAPRVDTDDWPSVDVLETQRRVLRVGAHWDATVRVAPDARRATITAASGAAVTPSWIVHPAVLDLALAVGLHQPGRPEGFWVPAEIGAVEVLRPLGGSCRVTVTPDPQSSDADTACFDLTLGDDEGTVVRLTGCELRRVEALLPPERPVPNAGALTSADVAALSAALTEDRALVTRGPARSETPAESAEPAEPSKPASTVAGGGSDLDRLVAVWRDVLGDPAAGPDTDFFQAGGHSLLGLRLVARIRRELGGTASLPMLVTAPSPRAFAALRSPEQAWDRSVVVRLVDGDPAVPPLHLVHGAGGNLVGLRLFARGLPRERVVFGYQANWVVGGEPDLSIAAMADRYVERLRAVQPDGPFFLAGYSGGGVIALEMAARLLQAGREVLSVVLLDTVPPRSFNPPMPIKLRHALRNLRRHGPRPLVPWARGVVYRKLHPAPSAQEPGDAADELAQEATFKRVYDEHELGTYPVRVLLTQARSEWPAYPDRYGLGDAVTGVFEVAEAPGDHFSMIDPANLPRLAELVDAHFGSIELERRSKRP